MHVEPDFWLVADEEGLPPLLRVPSVRSNLLDVPAPMGIVWHWTGGRPDSRIFAQALADEIRTYDKNKDRAASWHVLVAKDGALLQSVPFNAGSWHVGKPGRIGGKLFGNINRGTVGVELQNAGKLLKVDGKFYCDPYWLLPDDPPERRVVDPKLEVATERAVLVEGEFYDEFPQAQVDAATRLLAALVCKFKWDRGVCAYGHRDFDFPRKIDPGPRWAGTWLPRVLSAVFGPVAPATTAG